MSAPTPQAPAPFSRRLAIGLIGMLIASLFSGINDRVTDITLVDLLGVYGFGHDEGTWVTSAYSAAEVSAMLLSPWFAMTFSLRRFAIGTTVTFAALGAITPFAPNIECLITLRVLQGLAGGALPPLLMIAALRFLPWQVKLYGLSAYALTATFGPNISMPLASLWNEGGDWKMIFWQVVPAGLFASALVAYGLPQDSLGLERFKQADWRGALLGIGGLSMLIIGTTQGERLDWFNSPLISMLLLGAAVCIPLFLVNEWFHPLPLFKLQLLGRRNFAFGIIALCLYLFLAMAGGAIPPQYLAQVQGYHILQSMPTTLIIALPQIFLAPLVAFVINRYWVDSRYVMALGIALLAMSCLGGSMITGDWIREDFYCLQIMHAFGQPMVVVPLLMNATGVIQSMEGPFASAMVNTTRGCFTILASVALKNFITQREHFHSNVIVDALGNKSIMVSPLTAGGPVSPIVSRLTKQAFVLSYSDVYLGLLAVAILSLIVLFTLPTRAYPPQPSVLS